LDAAQLPPAAQRLRGPLEDQLSSALQHATEQVRAGYHGESVDQVAEELLQQTRDALHPDIADAFQPASGELRRVAEEIVSRT
jgi:hypothetical protein